MLTWDWAIASSPLCGWDTLPTNGRTFCNFLKYLRSSTRSAAIRDSPNTCVAPTSHRKSVACGNDAGVFHHQHDCTLRSAGAMHDTFGNDKAFARTEFHDAIFQIDQQLAFEYVEKFV